MRRKIHIVSQIYTPPSRFSTLPPELLLLIFKHLRPKLTRPNSFTFDLRRPDPNDPTTSDAAQFRKALKSFASFRRISTAVSHAIIPLLFEEVVIWITPSLRVQAIDDLFAFGGRYILSIVIYGAPVHWTSYARRKLPQEYGRVLGRGLSLCPRIRNLECYKMHNMFTRDWLALAPSLASTLTRLVIRPHGINISYALGGLAGPLETLEIVNWTRLYTELPVAQRPPHAPPELPNLRHITIRSGDPHPDDLRVLFDRITRTKDMTQRLHSVSLLHLANLTAMDLTSILSTNSLGIHLTTFRFASHVGDVHLPLVIAQACPNLVEFSCGTPTVRKILEYLSPCLREFGIAMFNDAYHDHDLGGDLRLEDLLAYSKSRRGRGLRTICLMFPVYSPLDGERLREACEEAGLERAVCRRERWGWRIGLKVLD